MSNPFDPEKILKPFLAKYPYNKNLDTFKVTENKIQASNNYIGAILEMPGHSLKQTPNHTCPNLETLIPVSEPLASVVLNPDYLIAVAKAAKAVSKSTGLPRLTLELRENSQPIICYAESTGTLKLTAFIMPIRF